MTEEEINAANQAFFEGLGAMDAAACDAVNDWIRSEMFLPFTGMPTTGFMHKIMPLVPIYSIQCMERFGIPSDEIRRIPRNYGTVGTWIYESGQFFYEISEDRLDREDYLRRLAARQVDKWEWRRREHTRRLKAWVEREHPTKVTSKQIEDKAYEVMGRIAGFIKTVQRRGERTAFLKKFPLHRRPGSIPTSIVDEFGNPMMM